MKSLRKTWISRVEFSEGVQIVAEHPDAYLIAEVWDKDTSHMVPFIEGGYLDSLYNFNLSGKMLSAAKNESTAYEYVEGDAALTDTDSDDLNIAEDLDQYYDLCNEVSDGKFIDCPFLANHDQARVMSHSKEPRIVPVRPLLCLQQCLAMYLCIIRKNLAQRNMER